jgi:hypothetical protein
MIVSFQMVPERLGLYQPGRLIYNWAEFLAQERHTASIAKDLVFIAAPLLATVVAAAVVLSGRAAGFSTRIGTGDYNIVSGVIVSCVLISMLAYGLKRHPGQLARVVVACITVAGTTSGLVLFKVWFEITGAAPIFFLSAIPLGYLGIRWSVKGYYGSLSQRRSNVLVLGSATLLGTLIGTSLSPLFTITFLGALALMDFLVVETNVLTRLVGPQRYGEVLSLTTLPLETSLVGLGDFLAYSMLVATSFQLSGLIGALETIAFVLCGALITIQITRLRSKTAGLVIPISLGMIPVVLGL